MKHKPNAAKVLTLMFTAAFLVACSSTDTKEQDDAAMEAQKQAEMQAQEAREQERRAAESARENSLRLEQAAMAAGTTFYFEYDSSTLTPAAQRALDAHIALLRTNERSVRLDGHTDERGTRDYNMALGERRANSVRDYMVVNGVASYRIETVSYGEEQPESYGSGESNWSQNRRVELK